ncbi:MAG TPA: zinc ribbon domain-containing protein [Candidatus Acidoferrales bacterium]|nr:zinc ribbon domain-containing protein [Candidatus Acidoferrales bacterium]
MPIYEYRCEACSSQFDVLTGFDNRQEAGVCPVCASARTTVQVSTFAAAMGSNSEFAMDAGGGGCACGGACSCSGGS